MKRSVLGIAPKLKASAPIPTSELFAKNVAKPVHTAYSERTTLRSGADFQTRQTRPAKLTASTPTQTAASIRRRERKNTPHQPVLSARLRPRTPA